MRGDRGIKSSQVKQLRMSCEADMLSMDNRPPSFLSPACTAASATRSAMRHALQALLVNAAIVQVHGWISQSQARFGVEPTYIAAIINGSVSPPMYDPVWLRLDPRTSGLCRLLPCLLSCQTQTSLDRDSPS